MKKIAYIFLVLPVFAMSQIKLSIEVDGVKSSSGKIRVAVYNRAESFLNTNEVYAGNSAEAKSGVTLVSIDNLPEGEYALAIFHDVNGNNKLDTNWMGVPKEAVGFSGSGKGRLGPPKYRDCVLHLEADKTIQISL